MKKLHAELKQDLERDEVRIAHLLIVKISDDEDDNLYFTNHSKEVTFFDDEFVARVFSPIPFKVGTITSNTETNFPQINLTLSNITRDFSQLVMQFQIDGREVILYEISLRKLDNPLFRIELFRGVLDKPKITEENFEVAVVSASEVKGIKLPRRSFRRRCQMVFGLAPECPYPNPEGKMCAKTYDACSKYGMTQYFGGFRKIASSSDVRGANG